jgi:hypothetical protein
MVLLLSVSAGIPTVSRITSKVAGCVAESPPKYELVGHKQNHRTVSAKLEEISKKGIFCLTIS